MADTPTAPRPKSRRTAREVAADIWFRTLKDDSKIAEVPLLGGGFVTVDQADLDRILALGVSPAWYLNGGGYVRAQAPARLGIPNLVQVARLILEPPAGRVVKYRDGNKINLRRSNLYLEEPSRTSAKARERFFAVPAIAAE